MKEEFVSYEQAVTLKELGFDELCLFAAYDGANLQSIYKNFIVQICKVFIKILYLICHIL